MRPLHIVINSGFTSILEFLLDSKGIEIEARNGGEESPLFMACRVQQLECVKILLKNGADANARDNKKRSPLHVACSRGCLITVQLLLDHGADVNAIEELHGETPLSYAASDEIAQLLRLHGAQ